jgi:hypothetical protein
MVSVDQSETSVRRQTSSEEGEKKEKETLPQETEPTL